VIDQSVKEKRELSTAVRLACVRPPSVESCFEASSSPQTGFGSFAEFPFPRRRTMTQTRQEHREMPSTYLSLSDLSQRYLLGLRLGPTSPCPSTVHMESYSASVFCVLMRYNAVTHCIASSPNRIFATTTKICTRSLDRTTARAVRLPLESHAVLRAVDYLSSVSTPANHRPTASASSFFGAGPFGR